LRNSANGPESSTVALALPDRLPTVQISPRHFAWRTSTRVFPSTSILTMVARKSIPWTTARLHRSASSTADNGCAGAATSRSPGRSANSESCRSSRLTPSDAATVDRMACDGADVRAASPKTCARARLGGTADFRSRDRSLPRTWMASLSFRGGLSHGSGSRSRASSSRCGRPMSRSCSSRELAARGGHVPRGSEAPRGFRPRYS